MFFLIISGVLNAGLNLFLVVVFHMGVAGVGIATVISQMVSCVLVLICLYRAESSYQLRLSKLTMKGVYLKQIFQVGVPAGIQSTVINFSNVLLQSSVNSFGSIAMAGYTAANNLLGFLYASVNSITQACMSFTSQNYGVGKWKRMDRVLIDCMILTTGVALVIGGAFYGFGPEILKIYTDNEEVVRMRYGDSVLYDADLFPLRPHGSLPGSAPGHGSFRRAHDTLRAGNCGNPGGLDLPDLPSASVPGYPVYFLSGILAFNDPDAGDLFLVCEKKGA